MDQAGCGYDNSCGYRDDFENDLKSCSKYNFSIVVKSYSFIYCRPPKIVSIQMETTSKSEHRFFSREKGNNNYYTNAYVIDPEAVENLEFENTEREFWKARVKWDPPESSSCIEKYL